jgi:hypothetical protein
MLVECSVEDLLAPLVGLRELLLIIPVHAVAMNEFVRIFHTRRRDELKLQIASSGLSELVGRLP